MNYEVKSIDYQDCKEWFLKKHYAKRMCHIIYCFGLFDNDILKGVISFGMPPSSTLSESIVGDVYKKYVIELNRLVLDDNMPKNTLSFFVSTAIKKLPKPKIIVSFSDKNMGHNGYIYQSTNFIYTGLTSNIVQWVDKLGNEFHFRNIGHLQKSNKFNFKMYKKRKNEHLINRKDIANYLRKNKGNFKGRDLDILFAYKHTCDHWFRLDAGFSFPSIEDWIKLKQILKFDDTFDDVMLDYELVPLVTDIVEKLQLKKISIEPKHRYLYIHGSKTQKHKIKSIIKLNSLPYPKGNNRRYDTSYNPTIQQKIF
jgi:hypothetical protein